jgi:DDE superfamily endonuclease
MEQVRKRRHDTLKVANIAAAVAVQNTIFSALPFLFRSIPQPMHTSSLSGHAYIQELLNSGNSIRIQRVLRMKPEVFQFLCKELQDKGGLTPTQFITVEEQVAMFLFTVARCASNRDVQERFQHSGETVSRYFRLVLQAINILVPQYIKLPNPNAIPAAITRNPKFDTFFNNCIGAMDGTHIEAKVPQAQAAAFRSHKGKLSQNVLAACDFDKLIFTYVLAGWEGTAHDGAVLEAAFETGGFYIPAGKYYLGDAGFGLAPYCLTPYRGVRYHLREWSKANDRYNKSSRLKVLTARPQNARELYNLRHASLRNAIERIFGVLKKRFKVLNTPLEHPFEVQVRIVQVLCCLHNIIRLVGGDDDFDRKWLQENSMNTANGFSKSCASDSEVSNGAVTFKNITSAQEKAAKKMRDEITEQMWTQYISTNKRRRTTS